MVLRLMALDPAPSLYLGRPCYLGLHHSAHCHPWHWTHGRYGKMVVDSLVAVLQRILADGVDSDLVLIGYSGGGTLAMLLAERLPRVSAVVTLAGNLDVVRWARLHDYSPLRGSLNPADSAPLPPRIRQWHWMAARDHNVPPALVRPVVAAGESTRVEILPNIDHRCCWEAVWPRLLNMMERHAETF
jgi:pimeloyl-ACP methyl ester carboxylesterase